MKTLKNKNVALLIFIFGSLAEYFHLLFEGELHSFYMRNGIKTPIYWDDMMYHFLNESFTLLMVFIACLALWTDKASKATMSSIFTWFLIEWIEISLQFAKVVDIRTEISGLSWIQLSICLTVFISVYFGSKK